jgi:hypothetical protein
MFKAIESVILWPSLGTAWMLALLAWVSCSGEGLRAETRLPDEFYGKWRLSGSSGGIGGGGDAVPDDLTIEIRREGVMNVYRSGSLESSVRLNVSRGRSIYSGKEAWLIEQGQGAMPQVVQINAGGTLSIADNAYDGFSYFYKRVAD